VISTTFDDREERPAVRRHQERSSDERGQTLVEFAALLPVLCLLLFGIIQFGVVFHDYITVTDASRVGARKAAVSRIGGDKGDAAVAAAKEAGSVTCNADDWSKAGSDVRCTVNYPYSIDVLGMVVASGTLTSVTTERLE
jgi:Flp pilus assembly protein TadG